MKKLYVGSLPYSMTDDSLVRLFSAKGYNPVSVTIVTDRTTGQSRGFGFVELEREDDARNAIRELDGLDVEGRKLQVNEARPQESRGGGGGAHAGSGRDRRRRTLRFVRPQTQDAGPWLASDGHGHRALAVAHSRRSSCDRTCRPVDAAGISSQLQRSAIYTPRYRR